MQLAANIFSRTYLSRLRRSDRIVVLLAVPLLLATGAGAVSRQIIGITVLAGMLAAVTLGLVLVPALYVLVEAVRERTCSGEVVGEQD